MKAKILTSLVILFLVSIAVIPNSDALKQVAGPITVDLKPGESGAFEWGLASDNPNEPTPIQLSAEGMGSEFLVFPEKLELGPNEVRLVEVQVVIPDDFPGDIEMTPHLLATEFGETGGATVLNIRMLKIVTLNVAPNDDSSLWVNWDEILKEDVVEPEPVNQDQASPENEKGGFSIVQEDKVDEEPTEKTEEKPQENGGGCLIATAAFGSELAPQVQMLREIRDNTVMSTTSGSAFMIEFNQVYYSFSPAIADMQRENPAFKEIVKITLTPMLASLSVLQFINVDSEFGMLSVGISLIALNVGMYFAFPVAVAKVARKKLQK